MGARDWALLLTLSVLWGGSFFFAEVALAELGPLTLVFGRVVVGVGWGGYLPPSLLISGMFVMLGMSVAMCGLLGFADPRSEMRP